MNEQSEIRNLKGIGAKTEELFHKMGIFTIGDLLRYYPRGYDVYEEPVSVGELEEGKISSVISTSKTGRQPGRDSVRLRRKAVELGIPCLTSLDTAAVLALTLESQYNEDNVELVDIAHIAHGAAARKELSQMEKPEEIQIPGYVLQEHEND